MASTPSFTTTWTRAVARDGRLTPGAKVAALAVFGRFATSENGYTPYAALSTIQDLCGMARTTARRAVADLLAVGWIVRAEEAHPNGAARYRLLMAADDTRTGSGARSQNETPRGTKTRPRTRYQNETPRGIKMIRTRYQNETQVLSSSEGSSDAAPPQPAQAPGSGAASGDETGTTVVVRGPAAPLPGESRAQWAARVAALAAEDEDGQPDVDAAPPRPIAAHDHDAGPPPSAAADPERLSPAAFAVLREVWESGGSRRAHAAAEAAG